MSTSDTSDVRARQQMLIATSRIVLDIQAPASLPYIASDLLVDGLDSQALRESAGMSPEDYAENLKETFLQAVAELDIPLPSDIHAREILAREWARQIVEGEMTPREGSQLIWDNVAVHSSEDKYLIFAGLGDLWDSYPDQRDDVDARITAAATMLTTESAGNRS